MLRGEVWIGIWPNDPKKTPRPLLIVSNNHRNKAKYILDVVVVKLTSLQRQDGSDKPTNPAEDLVLNFKKSTIIRCASIYAVEKSLLHKKVNQLTPNQMKDVDQKLKTALDLH
jgi:mRNA interferase MazF